MTESILSQPLIDISATATWAGVTTRTVRQWIADGKLPAYRIGSRTIRIRQSDLEDLLQVMGNE
jgi:excisionase family DNA binding protein